MITVKLTSEEHNIVTDLLKSEIALYESRLSKGILEDEASEIATANAYLRMLAALKLSLMNVEHS
jgi:hypothetical protein